MRDTQGPAKDRMWDAPTAELVALIAQVAKGDHRAFRALYDLTHRRLFGLALLMTKQRDAAEDIVQDAYLRIWSKAGSYDPDKGMPIPWLARIARNIALDRLRAKRFSTVDHDDCIQLAAEPALSGLVVANLTRCLEKLPPTHRAAWCMVHVDGLSRDDVAVRLNVPLGTVKSWVFRSSRRIRAAVSS